MENIEVSIAAPVSLKHLWDPFQEQLVRRTSKFWLVKELHIQGDGFSRACKGNVLC